MVRKKIMTSDNARKAAQLLKAIGHPVRLQVLEALERNEPLNVSELLEIIELNIEQSLLSHHLIKMRDKGVLTSTKKGMYVYYSLADRNVLNIFNCIDNCNLF